MTSRLAIRHVAGLATVQDTGRPGRMHEGVPRGGALVPELLARANHAAGNLAHAAGIELFGRMHVMAEEAPLLIALDDGTTVELPVGESLEVAAPKTQRMRYLSVHGGLAVPSVLGGRGTLLVAGFGGFEGRALRAGDSVAVGALAGHSPEPAPLDLEAPIRVVLGPDLSRFAAEAARILCREPFVVLPSSDRLGTRLQGPPLPRADGDVGESMPMVDGAIEVPGAGSPIVLGPDHPTTGGYPVIAVVIRGDLGRFAARPIGVAVRFVAER